MLRLRIVIPLLLSSLASAPALGEFYTSHCTAAPASPRCEAERARAFAKARNAEINASIARVSQERARAFANARNAEIDAAITAVNAERAREFAQARNAEINASIARVNAERSLRLALTHCKTPSSTAPRCMAEHAREFAKARNAEINASIATVAATRQFAQARNAEIDASIAAVNAERARSFVAARNAEINASLAAVAATREFEQSRNREINASIAAVNAERARAFATARNAEINASVMKVAAVRAFEMARNAEIDASIAAVKKQRVLQFAQARNAEIDASIMAVRAQRALSVALAARRSGIETGAISLPDTIGTADQAPLVRRARQAHHFGPCRDAAHLMNPLQFTDGNAEIEEAMKPELDRIAMMARNCPAIQIELHGYSDNSGPMQINRHLAQRRAQAAAEYLIQSGVETSRLTTIGHAAAQPVVPNTTDVNRAINRRVEVTIDDPAMQAAAQRIIWDLAEVLDPTYLPPLARLSP